jgi:hypothetical protein
MSKCAKRAVPNFETEGEEAKRQRLYASNDGEDEEDEESDVEIDEEAEDEEEEEEVAEVRTEGEGRDFAKEIATGPSEDREGEKGDESESGPEPESESGSEADDESDPEAASTSATAATSLDEHAEEAVSCPDHTKAHKSAPASDPEPAISQTAARVINKLKCVQGMLGKYTAALESGRLPANTGTALACRALVSVSGILRLQMQEAGVVLNPPPAPASAPASAPAYPNAIVTVSSDDEGARPNNAPASPTASLAAAASSSGAHAALVMLGKEGDSDSNSDDSEHMDSDEERLAARPPPILVGPNGKRILPKLKMDLGERSEWNEEKEPRNRRRSWLSERMREAILRRSAAQCKKAGRTPCLSTAKQYTGHIHHVLSRGRDNPYVGYVTLHRWVNDTDEKTIREHICKQFNWPSMNAPEVKSWLATTMSALRVLSLVSLGHV